MEQDSDRAFIKDKNVVKRLVIKLGTAVVTKKEGGIALERLQVLCEQIKELRSQDYEVILVTSGAVALGRQALKDRISVHNSRYLFVYFDSFHKTVELNGKACAAVGQPDLMALFKTVFSEDVTQAQCLVTESDFRGKDFQKQLKETVEHLLSLKAIPLFNENDAVSTRTDPYEDSSGIFWDNDSLAALLAKELKADLLILMSDVDGLYNGPPCNTDSELIHTYIKEKHQGKITFGEKSRVGRGGMAAKVKAAVDAASGGIPVVITSGFDGHNVTRVLQGERVGTLFPRDTNKEESLVENAREMAIAAKESSRRLQAMTSEERKRILLDIADALEGNSHIIHVENEADVCEAEHAGYEKSLISRLALNPGKITRLANNIRLLANMEDPIGCLSRKTQLADGFILERISCPLGVLLVIFESRPDALVQIASLAIRSGNGLLLKGGKEAKRSNAILHKIITDAIPESVGRKLVGLVTSRYEIPDLLKLDDNLINLVIPRGSNKLVSRIKNLTKIPVLGHTDGACHVYIDRSAKMDMAKQIVLDAKEDYPAACNAMETLLVHKELAHTADFNDFIVELRKKGVNLYGGSRESSLLNIPQADSLSTEYSSMACTVEVVDDVHAAIEHINKNESAHTDCIIAEDQEVVEAFLGQVDSAVVSHNASARFSDGARFGLGAEVGISTSRIHARGPGLLTTKWIIRGRGQVVDGDKGVTCTHKNIPTETDGGTQEKRKEENMNMTFAATEFLFRTFTISSRKKS
ncbi:PREDICTED: delta-1-pyrroline-5-carboxylate synthase-like [Fragaria vesca subsp. vesca]